MDGVAFYSCLSLAGLFFLLALLLMLLGEKGAILISGFNTWPKSKRDMYDKRKLVSDQARLLWIWHLSSLLPILPHPCYTQLPHQR